MSAKNSSDAKTANGLSVERLAVFLGDIPVGTLAKTAEGSIAFSYCPEWLAQGFSISPWSLPLEGGVFVAEPEPFEGLFGIFYDSLPDGWGALLLDRTLRSKGFDPMQVTPLARLAIVGAGGRGALRYEPCIALEDYELHATLDELAQTCQDILEDKPAANLDLAYETGGSSGGARPKAYVDIDGQSWLVKFPSHLDPPNIGPMEYAYALAAQDCGIPMAPVRLFPSKTHQGFFGSQRFDRDALGNGIHMATASALLEVSHRLPLLDYRHLFQVTTHITGSVEDVWRLFRLMAFNVFAHNEDDHSNNFAWLYEHGRWHLSPAYDLTYSTSFGHEHATTVNGNGRPSLKDVLVLGREFGLPPAQAEKTALCIKERCERLLRELGLPLEKE